MTPNSTPNSMDEARKAGWRELSREEVAELKSKPSTLEGTLAVEVDCLFAPDGTRCGGFGDTIVCFCSNQLCRCFQRP